MDAEYTLVAPKEQKKTKADAKPAKRKTHLISMPALSRSNNRRQAAVNSGESSQWIGKEVLIERSRLSTIVEVEPISTNVGNAQQKNETISDLVRINLNLSNEVVQLRQELWEKSDSLQKCECESNAKDIECMSLQAQLAEMKRKIEAFKRDDEQLRSLLTRYLAHITPAAGGGDNSTD